MKCWSCNLNSTWEVFLHFVFEGWVIAGQRKTQGMSTLKSLWFFPSTDVKLFCFNLKYLNVTSFFKLAEISKLVSN